ncbi:MAG: nitroreductase [FCB group bacterium]|nr:nitroreductase [FCB group bacterium]
MNQTASDLIQLRTSWRSCTGMPIPHEKLSLLDEFVRSKSQGVFGDSVRFELVAARSGDSNELKGLGTYGFIRGASGFVVGAVDKQINNLEDYGFLMEDIVLFATNLGLATCWLGGSFQKDNFSARINIQDHEVVPAVVSVGIGADSRNLVDRVIRNVAGSKKRLPWNQLFFETDCRTPLSRAKAQKFGEVFDMVRLSPSASNKQPWRIVMDGNSFHLFLKRTSGYRKPMFSDLQRIDMGIAMSHLEAVARELNFDGNWERSEVSFKHPDSWEYNITWVGV